MRFADVNGEKIRVLPVVVVNLNDVANLAAKRRSSEAAKHQHQRTRAKAFANMKMIDAVKRQEANVGGIASDLQRAAMHVRQGIAHHAKGVSRAARHVAKRTERRE